MIVTYESPAELLARCLASLDDSIGGVVGDIVVVDNASTVAPTVGAGARLVQRTTNDGFSAAVNEGIAALHPACSLVFLLNPDATVRPDAIARCVERIDAAANDVVGVAPKMLLADGAGAIETEVSAPGAIEQTIVDGGKGDRVARTIDCVGIGINARAEAANRGLGQPDLGQYDFSDDVFGACFGAALIRRSAFEPDRVGPLDERLFLYYEDVAWCWSAQLLGYRIVTEPKAIVGHVMSAGVVRERPYDFKFEHTERNLMVCALMFFEPTRAIRVVLRRMVGLLRGSLLGRHYPMAGLRALVGTLALLPHIGSVRRQVTTHRRRSDAQIIEYRRDEPIFFDSVHYAVSDPVAAESFARARLRGDRQ